MLQRRKCHNIIQAGGSWTTDPLFVTRPTSICLPCCRFLLHTTAMCQHSEALKQNWLKKKKVLLESLAHQWPEY